MQFRCFSYLHTRLLLALQQDIEDLERKLDNMDDFDNTADDGDRSKLQSKERDDRHEKRNNIDSPDLRDQTPKTRPQVIAELRHRLIEYGKLSGEQML